MKITICGSIAFLDEMLAVKQKLERLEHSVKLPPTEIKDDAGKMISAKEYYKIRRQIKDHDSWVWERKAEAIQNHFDKIAWSDVILVLNYDKNDIPGYVGGNTLMELGVAFYLKKRIFLFNPIPEISYTEEILGMQPIIIHGDLSKIV